MPSKKKRKKRFLIENTEFLPLHYSHPEEILTLAYDYKDNKTRNNKNYREQIQMAIEEFNSFNFAKFIYVPSNEQIYINPECPIEDKHLRKKYLNRVLFGSLNCSSYELAHATLIYSVEQYIKVVREYLNETITFLPSFSTINGNIEDPRFQLLGIGALVHEIFHVFGIIDLVTLNSDCTNGIFYSNKKAFLECKNVSAAEAEPVRQTCGSNKPENSTNCFLPNYIEQLAFAGCSALTNRNLNFTPFSLFSLQQYSLKSLYPFLILNDTQIISILNSYGFSDELKKDFFYLLKEYLGNARIITYQDISALIQAIYLIAPDTMMDRSYNVPYYHFIKGMYRPLADEEKFSRLVSAFKTAENFTYPILAQSHFSLIIDINIPFDIDLIKKLKVVSFTPASITCSMEKPISFLGNLQISKACVLSGCGQESGNFSINLTLTNDLTAIERFIELTIKEKNKPLNALFVGKHSVIHTLTETSDLDLAALCHVVSVPEKEDLKCYSFDLSDKLFLNNCVLSEINIEENYNFTVLFYNKVANKTCLLQLLSANISVLSDNLTASQSNIYPNEMFFLSNFSSNNARYTDDNYWLNIKNKANLFSFEIENQHYIRQLNYLLTIPFLHGIIEGFIHSVTLPPLVNCVIKLIPYIGLISINYLSTLQFPFLFFYSVFDSFILSYFKFGDNVRCKYTLNLFLLLLVAELEYGFSNLWLLIDKPQFFPALTERLNQIFVQMLWAPTVKATGYCIALSIMQWAKKSTLQKKNRPEELGCHLIATNSQFQPNCFFNSLKLAKDTVFSSKIKRIPSLFCDQFFSDNCQRAENDDSFIREFSQTK